MWLGLMFCFGVLVGILIGYARIALFGWEPLSRAAIRRAATVVNLKTLRAAERLAGQPCVICNDKDCDEIDHVARLYGRLHYEAQKAARNQRGVA